MLKGKKGLYLKIEVAQAVGIGKVETLRKHIEPLIKSGKLAWDNPGKKKGKGGKKFLTRFDAQTIIDYFFGDNQLEIQL